MNYKKFALQTLVVLSFFSISKNLVLASTFTFTTNPDQFKMQADFRPANVKSNWSANDGTWELIGLPGVNGTGTDNVALYNLITDKVRRFDVSDKNRSVVHSLSSQFLAWKEKTYELPLRILSGAAKPRNASGDVVYDFTNAVTSSSSRISFVKQDDQNIGTGNFTFVARVNT